MENLRGKLVVVFAGYRKQMEGLMAHNEGLPSRFPLVSAGRGALAGGKYRPVTLRGCRSPIMRRGGLYSGKCRPGALC